MGIFKCQEKILASSDHSHPSALWHFDSADQRQCYCPLYLYIILGCAVPLMSKKILGISAYYHDSAAALLIDGDIIAAAHEERFTRKKHDQSFPENAIRYVLSEADLSVRDLSAIAFYDKPYIKFERLLETYHAFAPKGLRKTWKALTKNSTACSRMWINC